MEARSTGVESYNRKPFSPKQIETRLRILAARMKAA
jgi:DNA-binding response OmpR family regulator